MTTAATILSLTRLVDAADAGAYTLPEPVTAAHTRWRALTGRTIPTPTPYTEATAAQALLDDPDRDPHDLAGAVHTATDAQAVATTARTVLRKAVDLAADAAVTVAADHADDIITRHLAPAHDRLLDRARDAAGKLDGHGLDTAQLALPTTPQAARKAYADLGDLARQRAAILAARGWTQRLTYGQPQHDEGHLFASLRKPLAVLDWTERERIPTALALAIPDDPTAALLWLVTTAAPAEPWLPSIAQRDQAWQDAFGDLVRRVQANRFNAQAFRAALT